MSPIIFFVILYLAMCCLCASQYAEAIFVPSEYGQEKISYILLLAFISAFLIAPFVYICVFVKVVTRKIKGDK